jgi:hypothetical protein
MKVSIDMEVWFDGQDGYSVAAQIQAIKEMIQSGAESFNFDVHINNIEVAPQNEAEDWEGGSFAPIPQETITAVEFMRGLKGFEDTCGSCRFFNDTTSECRQRNILVKNKSPKCPQWRYFA